MPVIHNDDLPKHEVPRIVTRRLAGEEHGGKQTAVWEQWIDVGGHIPPHYHEVEEVLVLLAGEVELTLSGQTTQVYSPATIIAPAGEVHGLRPAGDSQVHLLAFFPTANPTIFAPDGCPRPLPWDDVDDR